MRFPVWGKIRIAAKLRSVVVFLKITVAFVLSRPFGILFTIILFILFGLKKKNKIILFVNTDIE